MNKHTVAAFFNIRDFGAVSDGTALSTDAFRKAIDACYEAGGGTVYVPGGRYLTGPIHLKSNITLHIDAGARLLFSQNIEDYPVVFSRWEGLDREVYSPLIFGQNLENVAIIGRGILDGQGDVWWKLHAEKKLEYPRPRFISFSDSTNVLIEGITLVNSPAWTINPVRCENVTVNKVSIKNPSNSPNTDGINPDSCKNVHISNCHVDVGDDCITIKSGIETCRTKIACENITVTNCTMVHGHGGVVIGSEMSGGVRNVVISNCVFEGTDRGIRIKSRRGRGGVVEDIRVNNIIMKKVMCPFTLNLYYHCGTTVEDRHVWEKKPYPVTEATPIFRRIHLSNITAREVGTAAAFMYGLAEMPVEDITLENVSIHMDRDAKPGSPDMAHYIEKMKQKGIICINAKNVRFNNVTISEHEGPAFIIQDSTDMEISRCRAENGRPEDAVILMENVNGAYVHDCKLDDGRNAFLEIKGEGNKNIEINGNSRNISEKNIILSEGAGKDAYILV